ncbi:hypothetical protein CHS0354_035715, partial [Potamilus streckersoni]
MTCPRRWQADKDDHEICNGKVDDENVYSSLHMPAPKYNKAHKTIAEKTKNENHTVQSDKNPLQSRWSNKVLNVFQTHRR